MSDLKEIDLKKVNRWMRHTDGELSNALTIIKDHCTFNMQYDGGCGTCKFAICSAELSLSHKVQEAIIDECTIEEDWVCGIKLKHPEVWNNVEIPKEWKGFEV